ncbi:MAG: alpha/beta fold hydrolase [Solirubrobacterales bacterium]
MIRARDLDVLQLGKGPPVLFVHGSVVGPELTFRRQHELAERWRLIMPSRPGFGDSPLDARNDFEQEASLFAELLGGGAHLVGHSYGAVIALLAAAERPEAVRSLTVSEPGALRLAEGDPVVDEMIRNGEQLYSDPASIPAETFLRLFRSGAGSSHETPGELSGWLARGAELLKHERPPWEAEIPLDRLAAADFPVLVISGDHSPAFEAVCDSLAASLSAERAVIPGRGHTIPSTGEPYNKRLEAFLSAAEAGHAGD